MFCTDAMPYGSFAMDYPLPTEFDCIYPTRCGYCSIHTGAAVSGEPAGLLVYILQGEGTAVQSGTSCNYFSDCIIAAEDAASLILYPQEETVYFYLLLQNTGVLLQPIIKEGLVLPVPSSSRIDRLLGRICYNAYTKQAGSIYEASADAYTLLMSVYGEYGNKRAQYSPLVQEAIELMRQDYAFLEGMDELAQRLGVTKSHLIRTFSAATGISPGKYLQSIKLDNAKLMLQNRDYTIEMIADMVGYSSANYFCKVFRRVTGQPPGEFRMNQSSHSALDLENKHKIEALEGIYHV